MKPVRLYELAYSCRIYAAFTDFDSSLSRFRKATAPEFEISSEAHRVALLAWLRSWGCRQFALDYAEMASESLARWAADWLLRLPPADLWVSEIGEISLDAVTAAYADLARRPASRRSGGVVTIGPTGAAKVLFALRPNALPPWDDPIRKEFKYDGSAGSYRRFLGSVAMIVAALEEEAARHGIRPKDIPAEVDRPKSSLPKLIDEHHWVTVTRKCRPPSPDRLLRWSRWARPHAESDA